MATRKQYYVITGRVLFDDEDTAWITPTPMTRKQAERAYHTMLHELKEHNEYEEELEVVINYVIACGSHSPKIVRHLY